MITEASPTDPAIAVRLQAVLRAAYTLEAETIGCADFPPLHESVEDLRRSTDTFLVFQQANRYIAVLSFDASAVPVVITRLAVLPSHLRQGIATTLLHELDRRLPLTTPLAVSTAEANRPAVALYQKHGFRPLRTTLSAESISLIHLMKSE